MFLRVVFTQAFSLGYGMKGFSALSSHDSAVPPFSIRTLVFLAPSQFFPPAPGSQFPRMSRAVRLVPVVIGVFAVAALLFWLLAPPHRPLAIRLPGADGRPEPTAGGATGNPVLRGHAVPGPGQAAALIGSWSRFRSDNLNGIAAGPAAAVAREWPEAGPRKLWSLDVGEGYAGAAIWMGRAFLMDYDREKKEEALRCLSLADGREIWRYSFPNVLKRDHGVTRTVPAVSSNGVVAIGPKCHVLCVEPESGKLKWSIDLVRDHGATVPPWYTGQCPLVDGGRIILAPAGPQALLLAADEKSGQVLWRSSNPRGWKMTHSSVMPVEFAGRRMFVYCGSGGVAGVSAADGALLWDSAEWKISLATVPCPIDLGEGRIFLTAGYNAGSAFLQLKQEGDRIVAGIAQRLKADVFGATQHAPILYRDHLFGTRADGRFVCLGLDGKVAWTSEPGSNLGLGSFCIVNDLVYALNDSGTLHLMEANPAAYRPLAKARILEGPESWGPMAFADGRLIARDLNRMICLDIAKH